MMERLSVDRVGAVIVAAGSGSRFGEERPKQYEDLAGMPVFLHSIKTFGLLDSITDIVVVVRSGDERKVEAMVERLESKYPIQIVAGGATRQDSVFEGLLTLETFGVTAVLVHDAVRALVDAATIDRVLEAVNRYGAAIAALPVVDTIKRVREGKIETTVSRADLWRAQTPQGARTQHLLAAYELARMQRFTGTDESELLERAGYPVHVIEGSERNFKITYPADLERARSLLRA
jgi:2-C-methyl-D-erythritol 4-phosphate cytidylyltransferase